MQNFTVTDILPALLYVAAVFATLPGLVLLINTLVNVAKWVAHFLGWSFDGKAGTVSSVLQLVAFVGLVVARFLSPALDILVIDSKFKLIAEFLISCSVFLSQLGLQEPVYQVIRGKLPVLGASFELLKRKG